MRARSVKTIILCLMVILLMFQMAPAVPQASLYFDSQASSGSLLLRINLLQHTVPALDTAAARPVFQKMPARQVDGELYRTEEICAYQRDIPFTPQWMDIRNTIKETIPHYFYGSKYMEDYLNI